MITTLTSCFSIFNHFYFLDQHFKHYWTHPQGGYSRISYKGMCHPKGFFFMRNPQTWVHFSKEKPQTWVHFSKMFKNLGVWHPKFLKFLGVSHGKHPKNLKIGLYFEKNPQKQAPFFGKNDPQKRVSVLRLGQHIPVQTKSEYPPPRGVSVITDSQVSELCLQLWCNIGSQ